MPDKNINNHFNIQTFLCETQNLLYAATVKSLTRQGHATKSEGLTEIRNNVPFKQVHRSLRLSITTIKPTPAALKLMRTHAHVTAVNMYDLYNSHKHACVFLPWNTCQVGENITKVLFFNFTK